jgi:hypothetical protein
MQDNSWLPFDFFFLVMRKCSVKGCERKHSSLGYCHMHYYRYRKGLDINIVEPLIKKRPKTCTVRGCQEKHSALGFCGKHVQRFKKYGCVNDNVIQRKSPSSKRLKKRGDYYLLETKNNIFTKISPQDVERVTKYSWNLTSNGYAYAYEPKNKKQISLSRLIMSPPEGMEVDHINRNRLDNRRENLRICTPSQNSINAPSRKSKSKYKGVWRGKKQKSWNAEIAGKMLGAFKTQEEAALRYNEEAIKLYGEFAHLNNVPQV